MSTRPNWPFSVPSKKWPLTLIVQRDPGHKTKCIIVALLRRETLLRVWKSSSLTNLSREKVVKPLWKKLFCWTWVGSDVLHMLQKGGFNTYTCLEQRLGEGEEYFSPMAQGSTWVLRGFPLKNPAYGRQSISRPMRIVAQIPYKSWLDWLND